MDLAKTRKAKIVIDNYRHPIDEMVVNVTDDVKVGQEFHGKELQELLGRSGDDDIVLALFGTVESIFETTDGGFEAEM